MSTVKDIKRAILDTKREMQTRGIPVRSCMNGGHTSESYRYNVDLFRLKTELSRATA